MRVLVIYCHPSNDSFTYHVKENFVRGLKDNHHQVIVNDLYLNNFNSTMSESEYLREAYYNNELDILDDVKQQQELINNSDALVFIYPVFWSEAPSALVGWFQRVWTYGFAYGDSAKMKVQDKVLFLVTMGGDLKEELRQRQVAAMKEVMVGDRINNRSKETQFVVYDRMSRDYQDRNNKMKSYLENAYQRGLKF